MESSHRLNGWLTSLPGGRNNDQRQQQLPTTMSSHDNASSFSVDRPSFSSSFQSSFPNMDPLSSPSSSFPNSTPLFYPSLASKQQPLVSKTATVRWASPSQLQKIHIVSPLPPSAYFLSPSPISSRNRSYYDEDDEDDVDDGSEQRSPSDPTQQRTRVVRNEEEEEKYTNHPGGGDGSTYEEGIDSQTMPNLMNTFRGKNSSSFLSFGSSSNSSTKKMVPSANTNASTWALETALMQNHHHNIPENGTITINDNEEDDWDADMLADAVSREDNGIIDDYQENSSAASFVNSRTFLSSSTAQTLSSSHSSLLSSSQTIHRAEEWLQQHQIKPSSSSSSSSSTGTSAFTAVKSSTPSSTLLPSSSKTTRPETISTTTTVSRMLPVRATAAALSTTVPRKTTVPPPGIPSTSIPPSTTGNRNPRSRTPSPVPSVNERRSTVRSTAQLTKVPTKRDPSPGNDRTLSKMVRSSASPTTGIITKETVMSALGPNNPYKVSTAASSSTVSTTVTGNRGKNSPASLPSTTVRRGPSPVPSVTSSTSGGVGGTFRSNAQQQSIPMAPIRATVPLPSERTPTTDNVQLNGSSALLGDTVLFGRIPVSASPVPSVSSTVPRTSGASIQSRVSSTPPIAPGTKPSTPNSFTTTVYTWKPNATASKTGTPVTSSSSSGQRPPSPVFISSVPPSTKPISSYSMAYQKSTTVGSNGESRNILNSKSSNRGVSPVPSKTAGTPQSTVTVKQQQQQQQQKLAISVRETVEKVADWRKADIDMNPPDIRSQSHPPIHRSYPDNQSTSTIVPSNNRSISSAIPPPPPPAQVSRAKAQEAAQTLPSSPRSQRTPRLPKATHSAESKGTQDQTKDNRTVLRPPPTVPVQNTYPTMDDGPPSLFPSSSSSSSSAKPSVTFSDVHLNTSHASMNSSLDRSLSSIVHQLSFSETVVPVTTTFSRALSSIPNYSSVPKEDTLRLPMESLPMNEHDNNYIVSQEYNYNDNETDEASIVPDDNIDNNSVLTTESATLILPAGGNLPVPVVGILPLLAAPLPPVPTLSVLVQGTTVQSVPNNTNENNTVVNMPETMVPFRRPVVPAVRSLPTYGGTNEITIASSNQLIPLPKEYDAGALLRKPLSSLLKTGIHSSFQNDGPLLTGSAGPLQFLTFLQEQQQQASLSLLPPPSNTIVTIESTSVSTVDDITAPSSLATDGETLPVLSNPTESMETDVTNKFAIRGFLSARSPGPMKGKTRSPSTTTGPRLSVSPTRMTSLPPSHRGDDSSSSSIFSIPFRTGENASGEFMDTSSSSSSAELDPESAMNISVIDSATTNTMTEPTRVLITENGFSSVFAVRPRVPPLPVLPKPGPVETTVVIKVPTEETIIPSPLPPISTLVTILPPPTVEPEPKEKEIILQPAMFTTSNDTILEATSGLSRTSRDDVIKVPKSIILPVHTSSTSTARAPASKLGNTLRNAINTVKATNMLQKTGGNEKNKKDSNNLSKDNITSKDTNTSANSSRRSSTTSVKSSTVPSTSVSSKPVQSTALTQGKPVIVGGSKDTTVVVTAEPVPTPSVTTTSTGPLPVPSVTKSVTDSLPASSGNLASSSAPPLSQTIVNTSTDHRTTNNSSKYVGVVPNSTAKSSPSVVTEKLNNSFAPPPTPSINQLLNSIVFSPNLGGNDQNNMSFISQSSQNNTSIVSTLTHGNGTPSLRNNNSAVKPPLLLSTPLSQIQKEKRLTQQQAQSILQQNSTIHVGPPGKMESTILSSSPKPRQPTPTLSASTTSRSIPTGESSSSSRFVSPSSSVNINKSQPRTTMNNSSSSNAAKTNTNSFVHQPSSTYPKPSGYTGNMTKPMTPRTLSSTTPATSIATSSSSSNKSRSTSSMNSSTRSHGGSNSSKNSSTVVTNNNHTHPSQKLSTKINPTALPSGYPGNTHNVRATSPTTRLVSRLLSALAGSK